MKRVVEQFNGREGETAALLSRRVLSFTLRLAVSPHVISAVRFFFPRSDSRSNFSPLSKVFSAA